MADVNTQSVAVGGTFAQPANSGAGGLESMMWQASVDSTAGDRVSTMWATASASGTACRISAQGLATAIP